MTHTIGIGLIAAVAFTAPGMLTMTAPAAAKPVTVTAERQDDVPTRRVGYADLNLATLAGKDSLNRRVDSAVRSVCREAVGPGAIYHVHRGCQKFAWAGAKPQIALAVQRAREIAQTGTSHISAVMITISIPQ